MTELAGTPDEGVDEVVDVSDVEFPDGTTVTDPYTDALGQVYETRSDYLSGTAAHELDKSTPEDGGSEATPAS